MRRTRFRRNLVNARGFTLVEVIVVIATMTILFGLGSVNYRDFSRRQLLEGAVRMVEGDLRLTQQLAISGKKEPGCVSLQGYVFHRTGKGYHIEDDCGEGKHTIIKSQTLPEGVTISGFGGGNKILFRVLGRGVDRTGDTNVVLQLKTEGGTLLEEKTITVTEVGEIK